MSRRASKDANHDEIVEHFELLGCSVAELHNAGLPGWPDTVVGCIGVNHLVEIKNPATAYGRRGLNPNQQHFSRDWRGEKVWAVCSTDEATALVQNWRSNAANKRGSE
ncbi:hypothetical protein LVB77_14675 [Lysobacter sp. 5GHs7-4]|uniref:hypothetical protein n=1 Tax=Lysobacter sp. 5GHs7-4 TaxID=2904253 RepID=UPI001E5576BB|nr:hypothetical protein [Lysobacter sp. 5GHs7-4]UHQ21910.1 hypothetical protein LVB77_14675 [Lysobacter sp. 5GHs7-4]